MTPKTKKPLKNKHQKGSAFERKICRSLSLWWSNGEQNDIFWRSPGSGAWARGKDKNNPGWGDVMAVKPEGKPLTDKFVIELKRGYPKLDIISDNIKSEGILIQFLIKLEKTCIQSGNRLPVLIYKKDRKQEMICIPSPMYSDLELKLSESFWWIVNCPKLMFRYMILPFCDFKKNVFPESLRSIGS